MKVYKELVLHDGKMVSCVVRGDHQVTYHPGINNHRISPVMVYAFCPVELRWGDLIVECEVDPKDLASLPRFRSVNPNGTLSEYTQPVSGWPPGTLATHVLDLKEVVMVSKAVDFPLGPFRNLYLCHGLEERITHDEAPRIYTTGKYPGVLAYTGGAVANFSSGYWWIGSSDHHWISSEIIITYGDLKRIVEADHSVAHFKEVTR